MKSIARLIGTIVLVLAIVYVGLMFLNNKGFISGNFSAFLTKLSINFKNISDDTQDFLQEEGFLSSPSPAATFDTAG